jgi:hypothetical protein
MINFMIRHELLAGVISFLIAASFCAKALEEIGLHHWRPILVPVSLILALMFIVLGLRLVYQNISRGVRWKRTSEKLEPLKGYASYE